MFSEYAENESEINHVIENLCDDTVLELHTMLGDEYKKIVCEEIRQLTTKYLIKLRKTQEPVGLFGLLPQGKNSAGIFLLTTDNLHKGNVITFLKRAKKQVDEWSKEYGLIMDNCYKKNLTIQKWLRLLDFKPSEFQNDDFQVYYKGNIGLYNNEQY